jgi:hypothetical protein
MYPPSLKACSGTTMTAEKGCSSEAEKTTTGSTLLRIVSLF